MTQGEQAQPPIHPTSRLEQKCIWAVLFLGFIQAFNARSEYGPDGMSYLDLGEFWLKGDLANAVNGYWNPIYPIVLGIASKVAGGPMHEPLVAHMVNFGLLGLNLFLFSRLLRQMRSFLFTRVDATDTRSNDLFTLMSYLLFLWCHLELIDLVNVGPDLLVTTSVLGSAIFLLRLIRSPNSVSSAAGLGLALGLGYLVKAILFVAAPFFIVAVVFCAERLTKGLKNALIAGMVFALVSGPYVFLLSRQQGHPTYSEAGKLAYFWMVNKAPSFFHWQGGGPESGTPEHPTRQLLDEPDVFEFGDRPGTYPPWFDPAYWHKGLQVRIDAKQQLKAVNENLRVYHSVFLEEPVSVVFLFLFGMGLGFAAWRDKLGPIRTWPLLIPAVAGPCIYLPVYALPRHLGPFVLLLYLVALIICWPTARRCLSDRAVIVLAACGLIPTLFTLAGDTVRTNLFKRNEVTEQRRVALALKEFGLQPGDRIAIMGRACDANFARMARLKIVAEAFRETGETPLWARVPELEIKTVTSLQSVPAKVIIRDKQPTFKSTLNWKPIPNTRFAILFPE